MGDLVFGKFITTLDCPPDRVLESAIGKTTDAVVIGWDTEGEFYFASSKAAGPEVLWLLELAKKKLLEIGDPE
jgi:hypothetical protein